MLYEVIINNYQLGAMFPRTAISKVVKKQKLDKNHTRIVYKDLDNFQVTYAEKIFCRPFKVYNNEDEDNVI